MLESVTVKAPAKINLFLEIAGKRPDGYHLMKMIMQSIDLYDLVTVTKTKSGSVAVCCDREHIPDDERNIAFRTCNAFFTYTGIANPGVSVEIIKRIPSEAGLGGGSADAAGTLIALNRLFDTRFDASTLCEIGLMVGADVPFCIVGGTCVAEGIGEILTQLPHMPRCEILLAKPKEGMKTAESFARFDCYDAPRVSRLDEMVAAVISGDLERIGTMLWNDLQIVCEIDSVRRFQGKMRTYGASGALMTGSGSCVFGLFETRRQARRCMRSLYGEAHSVFLAHPVDHGASIIEEFTTK